MQTPWSEAPSSEASTEGEWGSPFAPAEAWSEYQPEAFTAETESSWGGGESEWGSPFGPATEAESWLESEIKPRFPAECGGDVTFNNEPWRFGTNNPNAKGEVEPFSVPRVEWLQLYLRAFDVDRYQLKPEHRAEITKLAQTIKAGLDRRRFSDGPIWVATYGATSTTASDQHNMVLSRHRAFNTLHAMRCELQRLGVRNRVFYGFFPTGEEEAQAEEGPGPREVAARRQVILRVFASLPPVPPPGKCPRCTCDNCGKRPPTVYTPRLCVTIPSIAPRKTVGLPPDVIPLGPLVPGLRMPFAIVVNGNATVKVDDQTGRRSGTYAFKGWGLEVALPAGRTVVDLRADLRASLDILVRASASLAARLQLGPLGLVLRIDASAFARLVGRLVAQLRLRLEVDLGRPNVPELTVCRPIQCRASSGGFAFDALAGPALLLVPGRGYGPAVIPLGGPRVPSTGLSAAPIPVPADKSTVKTLLALGGELRLTGVSGGASRELEAEWEQTYAENGQNELGAEAENPFAASELETPFSEAIPTYEAFAAELVPFA